MVTEILNLFEEKKVFISGFAAGIALLISILGLWYSRRSVKLHYLLELYRIRKDLIRKMEKISLIQFYEKSVFEAICDQAKVPREIRKDAYKLLVYLRKVEKDVDVSLKELKDKPPQKDKLNDLIEFDLSVGEVSERAGPRNPVQYFS